MIHQTLHSTLGFIAFTVAGIGCSDPSTPAPYTTSSSDDSSMVGQTARRNQIDRALQLQTIDVVPHRVANQQYQLLVRIDEQQFGGQGFSTDDDSVTILRGVRASEMLTVFANDASDEIGFSASVDYAPHVIREWELVSSHAISGPDGALLLATGTTLQGKKAVLVLVPW